jgi:hypothetical protein
MDKEDQEEGASQSREPRRVEVLDPWVHAQICPNFEIVHLMGGAENKSTVTVTVTVTALATSWPTWGHFHILH